MVSNICLTFVLPFIFLIAPTGVPSSILVSEITSNTLTFIWEEPLCGTRGDLIAGYNYTLSQSGLLLVQELTTSKNVTLDDLQPCTEYGFNLSARSRVGEGPAEKIVAWTAASGMTMFDCSLLIGKTVNMI